MFREVRLIYLQEVLLITIVESWSVLSARLASVKRECLQLARFSREGRRCLAVSRLDDGLELRWGLWHLHAPACPCSLHIMACASVAGDEMMRCAATSAMN